MPETQEEKSRRPTESKFHQQKLPAWQPLLTAGSVFPIFFAIGIIFLPLGSILLLASNSVHEQIIPYTHCIKAGTTNTKCSEEVKSVAFYSQYKHCQCYESFYINKTLKGSVYMYYGLTNFYQNHRRYVNSRDDEQLAGKDVTTLSNDCEPFRNWINGTVSKQYAPCGAIANSLFNDTFKLIYKGKDGSDSIEVSLLKKGIAWPTDVNRKFGIPSNTTWEKSHKPVSWPVPAYEKSPDAYKGYEDLIVWMRTAALPNFRKLYRRINHTSHEKLNNGLPEGQYELQINYSYPVTSFGGEKKIILSTTTWIGGRNPMLGISYIIVGSIHMILGVVFLVIHIQSRKRADKQFNYVQEFSKTIYPERKLTEMSTILTVKENEETLVNLPQNWIDSQIKC